MRVRVFVVVRGEVLELLEARGLHFRGVRLRVGRLFECGKRIDRFGFAFGVYLGVGGRDELLDGG